ncbi:hypothetical protein NCC49_000976 [Naganishia albida]|nr:hypothetical protein NCC49_000976 [Naganishia albida]
MRFTSAIIAALAIASIGAAAAPTPDGHPTTSVDAHKPMPTEHKPAPEHKPKPEHKPEHPKEPEYELVCKDVAFFHDWDISWADLPSGPVDGKNIYECAEDLVKDEKADAIVSFEHKCYPKTLEHVKVEDFFKNKGRDTAIEGTCEELEKANKHEKCYPEKMLKCCYDKHVCVKVPKKPKCDTCHKKDDKKDDHKKEEPKKEEPKKEEPKKDDHKKEEPKKDDKKEEEKKY